MEPARVRPRKTVDDFMKLPEGARAELISGEIYDMSPSPKLRHQQVVGNLYTHLRAFVREHALGEVFIAPFDVHLPSGDIVQPDVIFVSAARRDIVQDWIRGVPDLLVEVLSPERPERDRIVKRELYARNGASEYWIVDPDAPTVEVYTLSRQRLEPAGFFEKADRIASPLLSGLDLPVRDLTC